MVATQILNSLKSFGASCPTHHLTRQVSGAEETFMYDGNHDRLVALGQTLFLYGDLDFGIKDMLVIQLSRRHSRHIAHTSQRILRDFRNDQWTTSVVRLKCDSKRPTAANHDK